MTDQEAKEYVLRMYRRAGYMCEMTIISSPITARVMTIDELRRHNSPEAAFVLTGGFNRIAAHMALRGQR